MSIKPIRSFNDMLATLNRGKFVEKLDEELARAIQALEGLPGEKGGKATITVTVDLAYNGDRMDLKPAVKLKLPESRAFTGTTFWPYENGLSVQHPSQYDLLAGPREIEPRARDIG